jgi:hypothetical protein
MTIEEIVNLAPFLSTVTALIAVTVGPIVTLCVAKKQIAASRATADLQARANVLSKSRQEWINTLRNEIAGFMSLSGHALPTIMANITSVGDTLTLTKEIRLHLAKVKLLINPKEDDHVALVKRMEATVASLSNLNFQIEAANVELAVIAQRVLKREWERVKAFE